MYNSRTAYSVVSALMLSGMLALAPGAAHALKGDCAQPVTFGAGPAPTDCLLILQDFTGSNECPTPCICDANSDGNVTPTDALLCLIESVGSAVGLDCTTCPLLQDGVTYSFDPADCPVAAQTAGMVATDYIGAFDPSLTQAAGNWADGWTIELGGFPTDSGTSSDNFIWEPATGGTLGGGVPSADSSCPAGTTLDGSTTLPAPFAGSMDYCRLADRYVGGTVTLTNDNIYLTASAATQGTRIGDGDAIQKVCPGDPDPGAPYTFATATTMVIEPGTLILGEATTALAVTRGGFIDVNGTAVDPVVLNSRDCFEGWRDNGDGHDCGTGEWGGFILTGCGTANQCNDATSCDFVLEGFLTPFYSGGLDNTDNSGDIEYMVVRQAGFDIDGNGNELNCITMFNVGSGTDMEFVQCHENVDDGLEWFGGEFVVNNAVITGIQDDSIDTDLGFRGGLQFAIVKQPGDEGDRGYEMDSHPTPASDPLTSRPCFANITILGDSSEDTEGMNIGSGTEASWFNSLVKGSTEHCIDMEDDTLTLRDPSPYQNQELNINNYYIDCETEFDAEGPTDTVADVEAWYDAGMNNRRAAVDGAIGVNAIGYPEQTP